MLKTNAFRERSTTILRTYGIVVVLILMFCASSLIDQNFFQYGNLINVFRQVSINGIVAVGMTFVILSGGIDLSVGAIVAMNGMLVLLIPQKLGLEPWISIIIVLIIGVIIGAINGYFVYKGIPPFIMTLATQTVLRGVAYLVNNGSPVASKSVSYNWIGQGYVLGIPLPVVIYLVLAVVAFLILRNTTFGRAVYAVGGNDEAARLSGINLKTMKIAIYAICSVLATIAAVVLTSRLASCDPTLGTGYEADAIAATVIGGTAMRGGEGNQLLTIVGVLIIGVLGNILNLANVSPYMQQIIKGFIIFAAVAYDILTKKK